MNKTEEQIWIEKQMDKEDSNFHRQYENVDLAEMDRRRRIISKDDLLKEFSGNAETKLMRSGLFNNIFMSLMQGANRYEIIEQLVDMAEEQNKSIEKLAKESTYSNIVINGINYHK